MFQLKEGNRPDAGAYLGKNFAQDFNFARPRSHEEVHQKKRLKGEDFLSVETKILSSLLTDDPDIYAVLSLARDPDPDPDRVAKVIRTLMTVTKTDLNKKKVVFMTGLLASLFHVLDTVPGVDRLVFEAVVDIIHPILTNQKEFGSTMCGLANYIEAGLGSAKVFLSFIEVFKEILGSLTQEGEHGGGTNNQYVFMMKSLRLIFAFVVRSYRRNKEEDEGFDSGPFEELFHSIKAFLASPGQSQIQGYCFKSLFEPQTVQVCLQILDHVKLARLLADILDGYKPEKSSKLLAAANLFNSRLFEDGEAAAIVFDTGVAIAKEQIEKAIERRQYNTNETAAALDLLKVIYESVKKIESSEEAEHLVQSLVVKLLPALANLLRYKVAYQTKTMRKMSKVDIDGKADMIIFVALVAEINGETFDALFPEGANQEFLLLMFEMMQKLGSYDTINDKGSEVNFFTMEAVSRFLKRVSRVSVLETLTNHVDLLMKFVNTCTNLIIAFHSQLEVCTQRKTENIVKKYGDLRIEVANILKKSIHHLSFGTLLSMQSQGWGF